MQETELLHSETLAFCFRVVESLLFVSGILHGKNFIEYYGKLGNYDIR